MRRYTTPLASLLAQSRKAELAVIEFYELSRWEVVCWRMYGIRVERVGDELIIVAP